MQEYWRPVDAEMRTMDGGTATLWRKALDPSARGIIVTSYTAPALRERAQRAGACACVMQDNLLKLGRLLLHEDKGGVL